MGAPTPPKPKGAAGAGSGRNGWLDPHAERERPHRWEEEGSEDDAPYVLLLLT